MTSINVITSYLSNYGFFELYRKKRKRKMVKLLLNNNNINGLTVTFGSGYTRDLLANNYSVDLIEIPSSFERNLKELASRIGNKQRKLEKCNISNLSQRINFE